MYICIYVTHLDIYKQTNKFQVLVIGPCYGVCLFIYLIRVQLLLNIIQMYRFLIFTVSVN